jgi:hypothetical protein
MKKNKHKERRRAVKRGFVAGIRHLLREFERDRARCMALTVSDMLEKTRAELADIQEGRK